MAFAHATVRDFDARGSTFMQAGRDINYHPNVLNESLQQLRPAPMDASDRDKCLPETRVDLLKFIEEWGNSASRGQSILWLHGLAGSGKSTLSTTLAELFYSTQRLAAFLFFDRDVDERSDPSSVIRTIAYQMGKYNPEVGTAIAAAIKSIPNNCFPSLQLQFQKWILEPLSSLAGNTSSQMFPVVVILDALDECGRPNTRRNLLQVLGEETAETSSFLRIVITSRAEQDISSSFNYHIHILTHEIDTTSEANKADVALYLRHCANKTIQKNGYLGLTADWPGESVIMQLAHRADGLFVWAKTAWAFIHNAHDPAKKLHIVLEAPANAEGSLDVLYRKAMQSAGEWDDEDFVNEFRVILGVVIAAKNPLSSTAIDGLLDLPSHRPALHTISRLSCVLCHSPTVRVLHPSFADFLSSQARCGQDIWYFDPVAHNSAMAIYCLDRLSNVLKRNMCDLTLTANLEDETLPEDVAYACLFWINHICDIEDCASLIAARVDTFLTPHVIHWFEAMSILKKSRNTIALLDNLHVWITANAPEKTGLLELVLDARRFGQVFVETIEEHPLLVYYGALPFAPVTSIIYRKFHDKDLFPSLSCGFQTSWPPLLLTLPHGGVKGDIDSVAFSHDGTRIISSNSLYGDVCVWDAASGAMLQVLRYNQRTLPSPLNQGPIVSTVRVRDTTSGAGLVPETHRSHNVLLLVAPLPYGGFRHIVSICTGKTARVWDASPGAEATTTKLAKKRTIYSLALSSDDTRIVTGLSDATVRVWDLLSGAQVVPTMYGHKTRVTSVAFAPDGTRIVSGSEDGTVYVWDALSGVEIVPAIQRRRTSGKAVAFSPDSTRIVSGSYDCTVLIWEVSSGSEIRPAICLHYTSVMSVAFSPDGNRIVTGSQDRMVRIWDVSARAEVDSDSVVVQQAGDRVMSIAFSQDGNRIACGLLNGALRVLDALSGAEIIPAIHAHESRVMAVAWSADGTRIVSGSDDEAVRIWEASSGAEIGSAMRAHCGPVDCVAFSQDGNHVVSGSRDKTARVWDAWSTQVVQVMHGHTDWVLSVGFCPDGTRIVSGSIDNTMRVWDVLSHQENGNFLNAAYILLMVLCRLNSTYLLNFT